MCVPGAFFCEVAAEETPTLAIADEKPKEGVKTGKNDNINFKVESMAALWDRLGWRSKH